MSSWPVSDGSISETGSSKGGGSGWDFSQQVSKFTTCPILSGCQHFHKSSSLPSFVRLGILRAAAWVGRGDAICNEVTGLTSTIDRTLHIAVQVSLLSGRGKCTPAQVQPDTQESDFDPWGVVGGGAPRQYNVETILTGIQHQDNSLRSYSHCSYSMTSQETRLSSIKMFTVAPRDNITPRRLWQ